MWPRSPEVLPPLDVEIPDLPPRSTLVALPPVGLGTDHVEALTSYVVRLARAHAVSPRRLIRDVFAGASGDLRTLDCPARHTDDVGTINGLGAYAERFVSLTVELTTIGDIRYLSLLPLADLLPRNGAAVIARRPRWCPECMAEMTEAGCDVTRPLVWSLELYEVCHRHGTALVSVCDGCGKAQPFVPAYPDLGHCAHCRRPLYRRVGASNGSTSNLDLWVAQALADLVARLPDLDCVASHERFIAALKAAIVDRTDGNRAGFCKQIGLPPWTVKNWILRGERPSLPQLLAVARGIGVRPARLLEAAAAPVSSAGSVRGTKLRQRASRPNLSASERRKLTKLLAAIVADPLDARSATEVARTLGLTYTCLKYWFQEACQAIQAKYGTARRLAVEARRARERQRVADVVREMVKRAEYPGRRKVNEVLRDQGLALARPDLAEAYRTALGEHWVRASASP